MAPPVPAGSRRRPALVLAAALLAVAVLVVMAVTRRGGIGSSNPTPVPQVGCSGAEHPAPGGTWCQVYREDFDTPVPEGGFVNATHDDWFLASDNPYATSLRSYPDGWATTGDLSLNCASRTASVVPDALGARGVFVLRAHSAVIGDRSRALGGSFFPVIAPGASSEALQMAQTYGRYTVRFRTAGGYRAGSDPAAGQGYGTAFLLWPVSDTWAEGEVNFPEMAWGDRIAGFVHTIGKPQVNSSEFHTESTTDEGWHTATTEWSPALLRFLLNGTEIARATSDVPSTSFRWGFQSGGMLAEPATDVDGRLYVDSIVIESYRPAAASG